MGAVLCADGHLGYSQPIGGAIAYPDHISPSGVGYDIGCGNKAVATNLVLSDIQGDLPRIADEIARRVSFGMGRVNNEPVDHEVFDHINASSLKEVRDLLPKARKQLGTVGSGNHYVDVFAERETERVWIGVHFGSRGFGHSIASGFLALAQGLEFKDRATEGEMDAPPTLLHVDTPLGQSYIEAMNLAGGYAYAGRDQVCDIVLDILGAQSTREIHNHHNFAWREKHFGVNAWVVRKGCTPAFPGQEGFVGATMGEDSVILQGTGGGASLLHSTVHGAGRVMSRTEAAGKSRKRSQCQSCGLTQGAGEPSFDLCRICDTGASSEPRKGNVKKVWVKEREGKIDWDAALDDLSLKGIQLRGGAADEAPGAYKRLDEVLAAHSDSIEVLHRLRPVCVVMAGADTIDPYKD